MAHLAHPVGPPWSHIQVCWPIVVIRGMCSVALAMDKSAGAADEVKMLRDQLSSRDSALMLANNELETVRRQIDQLNQKYQTALQKYDTQQSVALLSTILSHVLYP